MKSTTQMRSYYKSRSCCVVNFNASKFYNLNSFSVRLQECAPVGALVISLSFTHTLYLKHTLSPSSSLSFLSCYRPLHRLIASHPGDNIRANGASQKWTPLRMLPDSGSIPWNLTKYLPSTRLQGGRRMVRAAGGVPDQHSPCMRCLVSHLHLHAKVSISISISIYLSIYLSISLSIYLYPSIYLYHMYIDI